MKLLLTMSLLVVATLLGGCVTETSGGLPAPASADSRVRAQLDLARGYLEQRDLARARLALEKALEIEPREVEAHVLSAVLFHAENEYELAEKHYKTALRLDPDNSQALNNYGTFLYSRGRYEDAIVPLTALVQDTGYRARSQAFESLGFAQLQAGYKEEAEASFTRALELNFRQPGSSLELAQMAYERGEYAKAARRLEEYKVLARQNAQSLCLGLKVATAQGDANQVASYGLALKNLFPEQADQCQATK
jgi:type IV pilus assembly protein PilF